MSRSKKRNGVVRVRYLIQELPDPQLELREFLLLGNVGVVDSVLSHLDVQMNSKHKKSLIQLINMHNFLNWRIASEVEEKIYCWKLHCGLTSFQRIQIQTWINTMCCVKSEKKLEQERRVTPVFLMYSQCGGSGMFIPDPGSWFLPIPDPGSRIPDPKTATKERGEKKLDVKPFYLATKFNKIVNYFSFEVLKKKIWPNFQRTIELFTKKIVKKFFKISSWDPESEIRDPGSEIRDPEKTHSGSRIQGSKRHRIPDPGSGSATLCILQNYGTECDLPSQVTQASLSHR